MVGQVNVGMKITVIIVICVRLGHLVRRRCRSIIAEEQQRVARKVLLCFHVVLLLLLLLIEQLAHVVIGHVVATDIGQIGYLVRGLI